MRPDLALPDLALPDPELVDLGGISVATWSLGPPDDVGPDVVLCHGTPWSAATWALVAHLLATHRRVRLWDMPGYGASPSTPQLDLATQAERFARLLELWGPTPPHVVAHDIGGAVALGAHLLHGRDYASLFLWDPVVLDPWGSAFFTLATEHGEVLARLPAPLHRALVREYVAGAAVAPVAPEHLEQLASAWTGEEGPERFYRQIGALSAEHTRPLVTRLGEVRCPTRVGWGEDDPWLPVEQAGRLCGLLPGGSTTVVVPGAGHLVALEQPEAVVAAIESFLGSSPRGPMG